MCCSFDIGSDNVSHSPHHLLVTSDLDPQQHNQAGWRPEVYKMTNTSPHG